MNKKILIFVSLLLMFITVFKPIVYNYNEFFSEQSYYSSTQIVDYDDIFYNPKSKVCELYSVGGFGHIDLLELSNRPELADYYIDKNIKTFDEEIIDKFNELMQQCRFIPIDRKSAFHISLSLNKNNIITYSDISSSFWVDDEEMKLFSLDVINEINKQEKGICEFVLFEKNDELYLLGSYAYYLIGGSSYKYDRPNFGDTLAVMYKFEESEAVKELIDSKNLFSMESDNFYILQKVNVLAFIIETVVLLLILVLKDRGRFSVLTKK